MCVSSHNFMQMYLHFLYTSSTHVIAQSSVTHDDTQNVTYAQKLMSSEISLPHDIKNYKKIYETKNTKTKTIDRRTSKGQ